MLRTDRFQSNVTQAVDGSAAGSLPVAEPVGANREGRSSIPGKGETPVGRVLPGGARNLPFQGREGSARGWLGCVGADRVGP